MRRRFLRTICAAALILAAILPATAARADYPEPPDDPDYTRYFDLAIEVLTGALEKGADGGFTPAEVAQLVQQTVGAVNGVKVDLLSRLDAELVNGIKGKTEKAVTSVVFLTRPVIAGPYVNSVAGAAFEAKAHLDTVSSPSDIDSVGRAMMTLFTILHVGDAAIGIPVEAHLPSYRQGLEKLVGKMVPACVPGGVRPGAGLISYTCSWGSRTIRADQRPAPNPQGVEWSLNGGPYQPGIIDQANVQRTTMAGTARPLAEQALEALGQSRP